jgi:hypothetical protein
LSLAAAFLYFLERLSLKQATKQSITTTTTKNQTKIRLINNQPINQQALHLICVLVPHLEEEVEEEEEEASSGSGRATSDLQHVDRAAGKLVGAFAVF